MTGRPRASGRVVPDAATGHAAPPAVVPAVSIMLVDDSLVVRSILERIIDDVPGLSVAASLASADHALEWLRHGQVDVIVLDIEMPGTNGLDALPELLRRCAGARVLVLSSNCSEGGPAALQAISLGASDTMAKPGRGSFAGRFSATLVERLASLGGRQDAAPSLPPGTPVAMVPRPAALPAVDPRAISCIAVGASTGGIPAIASLLAGLDPAVDAPLLITQHLPAAFMPYFAEQLASMTGRTVRLAHSDDIVRPGHLYLAPGDAHLTVERQGGAVRVLLSMRRATSGCCPSVDPMLASAAAVWGAGTVAVMLSGMGRDGAQGAAAVRKAGGLIIAQAAESCVVWGMPGAVVRDGLADAVLNPDAIALLLNRVGARARAA